MSLPDILEELDRLTEAERLVLARRLRAREIASDAQRTAEMPARHPPLQRTLADEYSDNLRENRPAPHCRLTSRNTP